MEKSHKLLAFFKELTIGTKVCIEARGLSSYKPAQNDNAPVGPHSFHIYELGI